MFKDSLFSYLLNKALLLVLVCLFVPLFHITYALIAWDNSVNQFHTLLNTELRFLISLSNPDVATDLQLAVDSAYHWINPLVEGNDKATHSDLIRAVFSEHWHIVQLTTLSIQLIALRLEVLMQSAPILLSGFMVGVSNGLLIWYLRRSVASMDSAFLYHRIKAITVYGGWFSLMLYFIYPLLIDPCWIIPLFVLTLSIFISATLGFFKKYL